MRILFLGDIVARNGRRSVFDNLSMIRERLSPDMIIVNGENSAHGFGILPDIADELFSRDVDVITGGNHSFDRSEIIPYMVKENRLIRPENMIGDQLGMGHILAETSNGARVLVINIMMPLFTMQVNDPFAAIEKLLPEAGTPASNGLDAIVVDVHGETTSEKTAMGHYLDGRVTLVVGTHTHIPTADHRILKSGTAYQTDSGMCGVYDSIIGMKKETAVDRIMGKMPKPRLEPAEGAATICGLLIESDEQTGLATKVEPLRFGGDLSPHWPSF